MKKKVIGIIIALCGCVMLTGCNKSVFDTNYSFDKAIIYRNGTEQVVNIKKWDDYEGEQIQLTLDDGSVVLVSSYNCILVHTNDGESAVLSK